jgi:hypothetical protein
LFFFLIHFILYFHVIRLKRFVFVYIFAEQAKTP